MTATRHCSHHALSQTGFTRTPEFDRTQPDAMRLRTPLPALSALVGPTTTICTPNMPRHQKTTRCENYGSFHGRCLGLYWYIMFVFVCAVHEYIFYSSTTTIIYHDYASVNSPIMVFFTTKLDSICGKRAQVLPHYRNKYIYSVNMKAPYAIVGCFH